MRSVWLVGLLVGVGLTAFGQATEKKTDAELKAEYDQAQKYFVVSSVVAALPLFEDLHAQRPNDPMYDERLAMCLLGNEINLSPEQAQANHARAKSLLLAAQSLGDNSPLLITLLEKMSAGGAGEKPLRPAVTPAEEALAQAEKLFTTGDMKGAAELYKKALDLDPKYYIAALYAGDALFKSGDCVQAGAFYSKAAAIDPDSETAFRYWGDCLTKMGDTKGAEEKYIRAIVAQPYQKTTRSSLADWATRNHLVYAGPAIKLPAGPTPGGKPGDINITLDGSGDSDAMVLGILYSGTRASWQKEEFQKRFPNEKIYRHSLPEEAAAIRTMLSGADIESGKKKKKAAGKDPSLEFLTAIEKDGMLECYILFDHPDQGIAQDYVAYRKDHRDLMAQYIAKYDVHPM